MALTQSQYDEIMRGYERRRERSRREAHKAKELVREKIPEYKVIEERITDLAMESAARMFDGDTGAVSKMRSEMKALTDRQKELLVSNGFAEDFLDEKYECSDCKDTGFMIISFLAECSAADIT